ncbi:MAG: hypothetical protein R2778_17390 [Saprospiraceae bacterium]
MTKTSINLPRRYPGLRPFERSQQAVFHSRQEDVQRLKQPDPKKDWLCCLRNPASGKTSLLQAGAAPELERHDYVPIMLRTERSDKMIPWTVAFHILRNTPSQAVEIQQGKDPANMFHCEQMKRWNLI